MLFAGLDVGGANLKAATSDGHAASRSFPLWKEPRGLTAALGEVVNLLPRADCLAVTMTGELADAYSSKEEGVRAIVSAALEVAAGRPCWFWQTGGEFVSADEAVELTRLVAAANWHALATFSARVVPGGSGLLLDVGSTTTDIIPLRRGRPVADGLTDPQRLAAGELVYSGAARTPLCAWGPTIDWGNRTYGLAAELFATAADIYLILGEHPENPNDRDTADGRPATIPFARARLARMLCADPDELGDLDELARVFAKRQRALLGQAARRVLAGRVDCNAVLIAGSGSHIARAVVADLPELAGAEVIDLGEMFARRVSGAACAFAVARLAAERLGPS